MNKFVSEDYYGDSFTLLCPECGNEMLHQLSVNVIFRDGEDTDGTLTKIEMGKTIINRIKDKDIPGRRDVLTIDFRCELCETNDQENWKVHTLQIMQHKGSTFLKWIKNKVKER